MCPPVALAGDVLPSALRYEFVVGFTRLGNLLGALDRATFRRSRLTASGSGSDNDDAVGCSLRNYPVI
jgi:hypothetical protein